MNEEQQALMLQLQQVGLTLADLREYLDTHPYDSFAISRFNMAVVDNHALLEEYREKYGPLVQTGGIPAGSDGFTWALQDFPWDY